MVLFEKICCSKLEEVDLVIDEVYEGGSNGNISDDVL